MFAILKVLKSEVGTGCVIQKSRGIQTRYYLEDTKVQDEMNAYFMVQYRYFDEFIISGVSYSVLDLFSPGESKYNKNAEITKEYVEICEKNGIKMKNVGNVITDNRYNLNVMLALSDKKGEYARRIYDSLEKKLKKPKLKCKVK
jgi:hypothetical protein